MNTANIVDYNMVSSGGRQCCNMPALTAKWRIALLLMLIAVILSILTALSITVMTQVSTHTNATMRVVRQYEGKMIVVGGQLLDVKTQMLDVRSELFAKRAIQFTNIFDQIFRGSNASSVYEGAEVLQFRIIAEIPALEVMFALKTSVDAAIDATSLLRIVHDGIAQRLDHAYATVDIQSLSIEDVHVQTMKQQKDIQDNVHVVRM